MNINHFYFQNVFDMDQTFETDVTVLPEDNYYLGKISITIAMFGLLVDSLGLAAVYTPYKVKADLLVPMLAFYALLVPAAVAGLCALILATFHHQLQEDNLDWEEEVTNQIMVVALPAIGVFYTFLWVNVLRLSRFKRRLGDAVMGALTQTFLQPLAAKATQDSHA